MAICNILSFPGLFPYADALAEQYRLQTACLAGEGVDTLMLLEHPPTITLGRATHKEDLLSSEEDLAREGITVVEVDRGGEITYHCPGQLVGYPILNLENHGRDLHAYLRNVEEVLIRTVGHFGVAGERDPGFTGVWTPGGKIAAIGIKTRRWVTMHGFALNINPDLTPFRRDFIPCGISDRDVTSIEQEMEKLGTGRRVERVEVEAVVVSAFCEVFGVERIKEPAELKALP